MVPDGFGLPQRTRVPATTALTGFQMAMAWSHPGMCWVGTMALETNVAGKTIAVWGLAFKPRTDDMREAPAIAIITRLLGLGAHVRAYDPEAGPTARRLFGDRIALCEKGYDALPGADALAIVTEWNEFREPDFQKMHHLLRNPVIFDGRNIYSPSHMRELGFTYYSIGR